MVKLSYTHRIERPEYRDLNPFINASDPKNITTGNTSLRPEIGDKIELNYSKTFEKGTTINATLFYRGNKDDIQSYTRYYSSYIVGDSIYKNVAVTTRENVGRENNYGLSLFASVPFTSKINLRTNISCFQRYIINGALPGKNVQGFNYRINMNATYQVTSTLVIELFGNFNSPRVNAQGTMPSFTTYNFAFRKQLFNKKASIAITATNPFNKYVNQKTQLTGDNFTLYNDRQLPFRSFGINFTYKFGKLEFKKEKETEDNNLTNPPIGN
jgi:outer membrane receptor for ferrienterochelin and colicin